MDIGIVVGIISIIGTIHFSFAKNLVEKMHDSEKHNDKEQKDKVKHKVKLYFFIPLSDGMVGIMFLALCIYLVTLIIEDLRTSFNPIILTIVLKFILILSGFLFVVLCIMMCIDIFKVTSYFKDMKDIESLRVRIFIFLIVFFLTVLGLVIVLCSSQNWCFELSQSLIFLKRTAIVLSLAGLAGWLICLTTWRPILTLDRWMRRD